MRQSLELLLGLLERGEPASLAWEDFSGVHGPALRLWQQMGFLSSEPGRHPVPGCPRCGEGVPYRIGERDVCHLCRSTIDPRNLLLWRLRPEAILRWLGEQLHLQGGIERIDDAMWQLGTWERSEGPCECFYLRPASLSAAGQRRLGAYRHTLLLYGLSLPGDIEHGRPALSLLELLSLGESMTVAEVSQLAGRDSAVRFDRQSGTLRVGDDVAGEVPVASKEWAFLDCLAQHLDSFVTYADLKHFILAQTGSRDTTEEAGFCHKLKNRLKDKGWVPQIDRLLVTTNKGDGYRLRKEVRLDER